VVSICRGLLDFDGQLLAYQLAVLKIGQRSPPLTAN
jgi:hypothetical protein